MRVKVLQDRGVPRGQHIAERKIRMAFRKRPRIGRSAAISRSRGEVTSVLPALWHHIARLSDFERRMPSAVMSHWRTYYEAASMNKEMPHMGMGMIRVMPDNRTGMRAWRMRTRF